MKREQLPTGFTLIELVISTAILAVILGGVASALTLATSALPNDASRAQDDARARLQVFQRDLRDATFIRELSTTTFEATIPDRDGDGQPDVIRYERQGADSIALLRTLNGQTTTLLDDLAGADVSFNVIDESETIPIQTAVSSASRLAITPSDWSTSGSSTNLRTRQGGSQCMKPTLPADAGLWRITQFQALVTQKVTTDPDSEHIFQIRLANADGSPSNIVVYQGLTSDFKFSGDMVTPSTMDISSMPYLLPSQAACLCLINTSTTAEKHKFMSNKSATGLWTSGDAGVTWSDQGATAYVQITGVSIIPKSTVELVRPLVTGVGLSITNRLGQFVRTPTSLGRKSQLLEHWWRADFEVVPTTEDFDGDGAVDWVAPSSAYTTSDLTNGWLANSKSLGIATSSSLTSPLDLRTHLNIATVGQEWYATMYLDQSGGFSSKLTLRVGRLSTAAYQIRLYENWPIPGTLLLDRTIAIDDMELRLVSVPQKDVVTLFVNDALVGSVAYARTNLSLSVSSPILLYGTSTRVLLDWVEARVGGSVQ